MSNEHIRLVEFHELRLQKLMFAIFYTRINDISIAMSYSSCADPGLRVAFKCLNV